MRLINGFTKAKVMEIVKKYNNGTKARISGADGAASGTCAYETSNGNRCAVGAFIPDCHEALSFEGPADELLDNYPDLEEFMPFENSDLCAFQEAHDLAVKENEVYESVEHFLTNKVKE